MNNKPIQFKGRAASSNDVGRFETQTRQAFDDGWNSIEEAPSPLKTEVFEDAAKSIINYVNSPDIPFDRTINHYRGCEHGCIYCYARPTHAYLGYSAGLDFETKLFIKSDAIQQLKKELMKPSYQCAPIALGMNTDAYQPIEREYQLTRRIIQTLAEANHPFSLVTKSALVERDIDLLAPMAERGLVKIFISITSLDREVMRAMEPRANAPERRLLAIRRLAEAKIPVGVMIAPIIPALTDHAMEAILTQAKEAGASSASYVFLRLPHELTTLFQEWLQLNFPLKAEHVLSLIRQSRGGKLYQADFKQRMRGQGLFADMLAQRFALTCQKLKLNQERHTLTTTLFHVPTQWQHEFEQQKKLNNPQMGLF